MRTWSDSPFEATTPLHEVAARGAVIAAENGESEVIYECADHPGWLVKLYRPDRRAENADVLARLIALPARMPAADRALIDRSVCWPVTRIVDGAKTVGVAVAKASPEFYVPMRMISGGTTTQPLEIDHLVQADPEFYAQRGWEVPGPAERLAVARNLAAVGAMLERYDVVYGDWSYANALWTRGSGRIFVIDVDACGISERPWVESKAWDDPCVTPGTRLTVRTDRYKMAVLILRCLTGVRGPDLAAAYGTLPATVRDGPLGDALRRSLGAADPNLRPLISDLLALLDSATASRLAQGPADARRLEPPGERRPHKRRPSPRFSTARLVTLVIAVCVTVLILLAGAGLVASLFS
ncbi:hypothetical protein [Nonomuraea typhae]|uniref:hypothetical protein n=1 Tax=Nonomuraea typhae TaxID=2603600 RepID=UPI0012F8CF45|nr:hypothetical protein [Nonomuraea typhae]